MLKMLNPEASLELRSESNFLDAFVAFVEASHKPGTAKAFFEFDTLGGLDSISQPTLVVGSSTDTLANYHDLAVKTVPGAKEHNFAGVHPLYRMTQNDRDSDGERYADMLDAFLKQ